MTSPITTRRGQPWDGGIRTAVTGSRSWTDYGRIHDVLLTVLTDSPRMVLVHGGAPTGADAMVEKFAEEHGVEQWIFPAAWTTYGKRAGILRNRDIIDHADVCVAFRRSGYSRGTDHCMGLALENAIPVWLVQEADIGWPISERAEELLRED